MQGRTTTTVLNRNEVYECSVNIISATFDGVTTHTVDVQFTKPTLNTQYGRAAWRVGVFSNEQEAHTEGVSYAKTLTRLVKAAMKLPRKWKIKTTGRQAKVRF